MRGDGQYKKKQWNRSLSSILHNSVIFLSLTRFLEKSWTGCQPSKFFEHITGTDGLYEIRVEFESNIY